MTQLNTPSAPGATPGGNVPQPRANTSLIIIAISLGLVAVLLHSWYVHQIKAEQEQGKITIYKLNRGVKVGDKIKMDDLSEVKVFANDRDHYVEGLRAITSEEIQQQLDGTQKIQRPAATGEFLTFKLYTLPGVGDGVGPDIPEGKQGLTIEINRDTAPATLQVGSLVDLYALINAPSRGGGHLNIELIMERVPVVALGNRTTSIMIAVDHDLVKPLLAIRQYAKDHEFVVVPRNANDFNNQLPDGSPINPKLLSLPGVSN